MWGRGRPLPEKGNGLGKTHKLPRPRGLAEFVRTPPRGNNGQCVQNCERDFHSKVAPLLHGDFGLHPYMVNIELKGPDDLGARQRK
eukprot:2855376-Pyramimonas_sp.AAC.1